MTVYTQKGGVQVQAFQWTGQALSSLPAFAHQLALQTSGSDLHVPTRVGTIAAHNNDFVVMDADGSITVMPAAAFNKLYS